MHFLPEAAGRQGSRPEASLSLPRMRELYDRVEAVYYNSERMHFEETVAKRTFVKEQ